MGYAEVGFGLLSGQMLTKGYFGVGLGYSVLTVGYSVSIGHFRPTLG